MTPTEHDLDRAWEPLARFVRNNALIHACMDLHASGRLSELTAKLTAVDALRFRLRELGGRDCDDEDLLFAIRTAALHSPQVGEYGPLHALIASLAKQMDTLVRRQVSEMERSQLSAFKIGSGLPSLATTKPVSPATQRAGSCGSPCTAAG